MFKMLNIKTYINIEINIINIDYDFLYINI